MSDQINGYHKSETLQLWTVYDHPRDFPNCYVARLYEVDEQGGHPTARIIVTTDLEELRTCFRNMGLKVLSCPLPNNDPKILEVWL